MTGIDRPTSSVELIWHTLATYSDIGTLFSDADKPKPSRLGSVISDYVVQNAPRYFNIPRSNNLTRVSPYYVLRSGIDDTYGAVAPCLEKVSHDSSKAELMELACTERTVKMIAIVATRSEQEMVELMRSDDVQKLRFDKNNSLLSLRPGMSGAGCPFATPRGREEPHPLFTEFVQNFALPLAVTAFHNHFHSK